MRHLVGRRTWATKQTPSAFKVEPLRSWPPVKKAPDEALLGVWPRSGGDGVEVVVDVRGRVSAEEDSNPADEFRPVQGVREPRSQPRCRNGLLQLPLASKLSLLTSEISNSGGEKVMSWPAPYLWHRPPGDDSRHGPERGRANPFLDLTKG